MFSFHGTSCEIQYNRDFSGEIVIKNHNTNEEIKVDAIDVIKFVADRYIRKNKINQIDSTNWEEFLK